MPLSIKLGAKIQHYGANGKTFTSENQPSQKVLKYLQPFYPAIEGDYDATAEAAPAAEQPQDDTEM